MAKSKPKKSKPKQTAAQKNLSSWTKTVNKYSGDGPIPRTIKH